MNIAIVLPCFKRVTTLNELCLTLLKADYEGDSVSLVFSIDYSGTKDVSSFAKSFDWPFGPKRIIEHETNIGLRNNILSCGDLTSEYDAVIVIEDDLEVSPSFYRFAKGAAQFYNNDDRIGGVSIYQYFTEEISHTLFLPVYEGFDAYFVQWASSWGQLWTRKQWASFREWYNTHQDISQIAIPLKVRNWKKSWKKYYIAYLTDTNRFFVFPFVSQIYNGNKAGGIHSESDLVISTSSPFDYVGSSHFRFPEFDKVSFKYDAYFQLLPREIKIDGIIYKVEFDLYGHKEQVFEDYVVTSKKCSDSDIIFSFDSGMLPLECNILSVRPGNTFHLIARKYFDPRRKTPLIPSIRIRQNIVWKSYIHLYFNRMFDALKRHFCH